MYMNYYCYMLFFPMIMISSFMIFITSSYFSMWMIMEINLISFISMMIFEKIMKFNNIMNYFIIQSFNSYMFLMSSVFLNFNSNKLFNLMLLFMNFSILMKISIFPFHLWYIKIIKSMSWMNIFILSTIQKIIPLYCLNYIMMMNSIIIKLNIFMLMISSFFCSILGINQSSIKLLMSYSSMIQMSWIIMLMMINEIISMLYFLIYMMISLSISLMLLKFNINELMTIYYMKSFNKFIYLNLFLLMMSLAGTPPFLGFLMKWISIQSMSNFFPTLTMMMMIINSLISMFFYYRLMMKSMMNFSVTNKIKFKFISMKILQSMFINLLSWISIFMLLIFEIV